MQSLNDEQRKVLETGGDVLTVAGPGSGKTRTLIYKIAQQLKELRSHRESVVAITYTHVAAEEIYDRIAAMGIDTSQLWVGTIHSFCLRWILRPYSLYHPLLKDGFGVADIFETERLLDQISQDYPLVKGHYDCNYFATEDGYDLDRNLSSQKKDEVSQVISAYQKQLLGRKLVDFEMMLKFSYDLLVSHPQIAKRLGWLISFIAIDEYQDTKEIQYSIFSKIIQASHGHTNLFLVGDPNQAIFGSLGGVAKSQQEISALTQRSITELTLRRNYRSSQQLVTYFSQFAVSDISTEAVGRWKAYSSDIVHDTGIHKRDLVRSIAKLVQHHIEKLGIRPEDICIVAPWWLHLASITRSLVEELPAYEFNGPGLSPFGQNLDNFWFKVARIALTTAAPNMFKKRLRWSREIIDELVLHGYVSNTLTARQLLKITNGFSSAATQGTQFLVEFFDDFCNAFGFNPAEGSALEEQRIGFFRRMNNRLARIFETERIDLDDTETFKKVFRPRNGIVVSTIHGVKGTEFDTVIAFGLLEGIVPHFTEPAERKNLVAKRLLYVTGSRARKHLYLVSEKGRGNYRYPKIQSDVLKAVNAYPYTALSIHDERIYAEAQTNAAGELD